MNSLDLRSIWAFTRSRVSPDEEALLEPLQLGESALIQSVISLGKELIASFSGKKVQFQYTNFCYLIRKVEILVILFEYIYDMKSCVLPAPGSLYLKELPRLFSTLKVFLDYCFESSRIWILIQNEIISHQLHGICKEILTVLDIFPLKELNLCEDVRELVELLKEQLARKKVFIDPQDDAMRKRLLSFVNELEAGRIPKYVELKTFFVDKLGIQDAKTLKHEMQFLGDLLTHHKDELKFLPSLVVRIIVVTQYCRLLLFGFDEDEENKYFAQGNELQPDLVSQVTEETFNSIQRDLSCPIVFELFQDPVIISTGQTYERTSISHWLTRVKICPNTKQPLSNTDLVPNRAIRSLSSKWRYAFGIPSASDPMDILFTDNLQSESVIIANKATGYLLVNLLSSESIGTNIFAAHELHLLAKGGKRYQAFIAEAGALPLLQRLLLSCHSDAQEKSVKAIYFLSEHENNKILIMEQLAESVVHVLVNGQTDEGTSDAASTLSSLCAIYDYRARIGGIEGAVDALLMLLKREGRAKMSAVKTLVLLASHANNCSKLIEAGRLKCLAEALGDEDLAEHAAAIYVSLIRHPLGANVIKEDVRSFQALLRWAFQYENRRAMTNAYVALTTLFPGTTFPRFPFALPAPEA